LQKYKKAKYLGISYNSSLSFKYTLNDIKNKDFNNSFLSFYFS
jgi:hypothetical protein